MSRADVIAKALTDAVLVQSEHEAQRIKDRAIRDGGFAPNTQHDAMQVKREILTAHLAQTLPPFALCEVCGQPARYCTACQHAIFVGGEDTPRG